MQSTPNLWFTSDTHWNHKNIVKGTTNWGDTNQRCREFDTLEEHNTKIIQNINEVVKYSDTLYHLGDWSFGGFEAIKKFRDQLHCRTIHLVFGNHDHHIENNRENCQDLFASAQYYKEFSTTWGQRIILSHYAMRVWNKSHHGSWMLYGHSHGTLSGYEGYKTMDVGVDTNDLKPYSIEDLKHILDKRTVLQADHHNPTTN